MTTITPEQFMATPQPDEDDTEEVSAPTDPLTSIAASLQTLVSKVLEHEESEREADQLNQTLNQLDTEYAELQAKVDQVAELIKPSTSKLANAIREVLDPPAPSEPAATEPGTEPVEQPADDAPVEEWRVFGAARGLEHVEGLNRSQIRSALDIPQPVSEA